MKYRGARLRRIAYSNFIGVDMRRTLCAAKHYAAQPPAHSPEFEGKARKFNPRQKVEDKEYWQPAI